MDIICVAQQKGGVGKTTITKMLCEFLARKGKRVLAIDMDPQCSLSNRFLKMTKVKELGPGWLPPPHPDRGDVDPEDFPQWDGRSSVADIFYGGPALPYPTETANLEILPGHGNRLLEVDGVLNAALKEKLHRQLANAFARLSEGEEQWDVAIIDTPPSKGSLTFAALRACSHVLIPCLMEMQATEGLSTMLSMTREQNGYRTKPIKILGIVPNKVKKVSLHSDAYKDLTDAEAIKDLIFPITIGDRIAFAEMDTTHGSVFDLPQANNARLDAEAFCAEFERRLAA
jgi:chromosome partitioning protein